MSLTSIREWLNALSLGEYIETFERQRITPALLSELTEQDLKDIGVGALGDRKALLKAIAQLRADTPAAPQALPAGTQDRASPDHAERRQITVLFCDMVGFTALANRLDPEQLRQVVREYEDLCAAAITRFEGYVYQRLGDGIVAYFGFPLAHEAEAERAILAGQAILEALKQRNAARAQPLQVRIGIATGMVVIDRLGDPGAVGDTMNLAARLQARAAPGEILVAERTRQLAGGSFNYADLGPQSLKGMPEPVRLWQVLGRGTHPTRFEAATQNRPTPLVGREQELALLEARWRQAREGEGQVVLLNGEAGIGKSRLMSALRERLAPEIATARAYQCTPFFSGSPLFPFLESLSLHLEFEHTDSDDAKLDKLEAWVTQTHRQPRLLAQLLAQALALPTRERYGELSTSPQRQKDDLLHGIVKLMVDAARAEATLMVVEDAHWADPSSLQLIDLLVQMMRDAPMLLIISHRPDFVAPWKEQPHVLPLTLTRLSRQHIVGMIRRLAADRALPPVIEQHIIEKTDGVPLFVEELSKSILESEVLDLTGGEYALKGGMDRLSVPATLRDSLMARLDRLQQVKEIAQIGAALGREFSHDLLAALAPLSEQALDAALGKLIDAGLLFRRGTPADVHYLFKHALVQDVAYESMLLAARRALHERIARVLLEFFPSMAQAQPELLAHHQIRAGQAREAILSWQRAARIASQRLALTEAIAYLEQALAASMNAFDESPEEGKRMQMEVRLALGRAWIMLRGWGGPEALAHFTAAHELGLDWMPAQSRALVYWGIGVRHLMDGQINDAMRWSQEALRDSAAMPGSAANQMAHMAASCYNLFAGNFLKCEQHAHSVLLHLTEEQEREVLSLTNQDAGVTTLVYLTHAQWALGYAHKGLATMAAHQASARQRGHPFQLGFSLGFGSEILNHLGNAEQLHALADECEHIGTHYGLPFFSEVNATAHRTHAAFLLGNHQEAVRLFGKLLGLPFLPMLQRPMHRCVLARALSCLGRDREALTVIGEALDQIEHPGMGETMYHAEALRVRGLILWRTGEHAQAEQTLHRALAVARAQSAKTFELRAGVTLAELLVESRRRQEALALLAPVYEWFSDGFDTADLTLAKQLLHS